MRFQYEPDEATKATPAGARPLWMYIGRQAVGEKLMAVECVQVMDDEGNGFITSVAEPIEVTVVDG